MISGQFCTPAMFYLIADSICFLCAHISNEIILPAGWLAGSSRHHQTTFAAVTKSFYNLLCRTYMIRIKRYIIFPFSSLPITLSTLHLWCLRCILKWSVKIFSPLLRFTFQPMHPASCIISIKNANGNEYAGIAPIYIFRI